MKMLSFLMETLEPVALVIVALSKLREFVHILFYTCTNIHTQRKRERQRDTQRETQRERERDPRQQGVKQRSTLKTYDKKYEKQARHLEKEAIGPGWLQAVTSGLGWF